MFGAWFSLRKENTKKDKKINGCRKIKKLFSRVWLVEEIWEEKFFN